MNSNKTQGFSLIELLVVFSIIMVLTGAGYMSFNEIIQNRTLQKAEKELRSVLYQAKQGAFYGKKPVSTCNQFNGNIIGYTSDSIFYDPSCDGSKLNGYTKIVNFNEGVVLSETVTCTNLTFYSVAQGTSLTSDCIFTLTVGAKTANVIVDDKGEIK